MADQESTRVSWKRGRLACSTPRQRPNPDISPTPNRPPHRRGSASSPEPQPPAPGAHIATAQPSPSQQARSSWERGRLACSTPRQHTNPGLSAARNWAPHRRGSASSPEPQPPPPGAHLATAQPSPCQQARGSWERGRLACSTPRQHTNPSLSAARNWAPHRRGSASSPEPQPPAPGTTSQPLSPAPASKPAFPGSAGVSPAALPGNTPTPAHPLHATGRPIDGGAPAPPNPSRLRQAPPRNRSARPKPAGPRFLGARASCLQHSQATHQPRPIRCTQLGAPSTGERQLPRTSPRPLGTAHLSTALTSQQRDGLRSKERRPDRFNDCSLFEHSLASKRCRNKLANRMTPRPPPLPLRSLGSLR
jgi:hypothetical protein